MPKCDTSKALVALDGAVALTAGVIGLAVASEGEPAIALLPISIGALYLGGAVSGNRSVNRCRDAMGEFESYAEARATDTLAPAPAEDVALDEDQTRRMKPRLEPTDEPSVEPVPSRAPVTRQPVAAGSLTPTPTLAPTPTPTPAPPPATVAAPLPPPTPKKPAKPQPQPKAPDDDWADFWREVD